MRVFTTLIIISILNVVMAYSIHKEQLRPNNADKKGTEQVINITVLS